MQQLSGPTPQPSVNSNKHYTDIYAGAAVSVNTDLIFCMRRCSCTSANTRSTAIWWLAATSLSSPAEVQWDYRSETGG